jgi:hypothetical protein
MPMTMTQDRNPACGSKPEKKIETDIEKLKK